MQIILDAFLDTLTDTAKMLPFLFGVYLLIEFLEHKASDKLSGALRRLGPFGPLGGAAMGCLPQCGFSVAASNLYAGRLISVGTLLAVFIATSDEAVPILLASSQGAGKILPLIAAKVIAAVAAGLSVDLIVRIANGKRSVQNEPYHDLCEDCGCDEHGILYSALKHTAQITAFVFTVSLVLSIAMGFAGEEALHRILMTDSPLQPFITALIGLIPNCAASVVLTNLYAAGSLSFGAVISGLSTGAGLGLVVLFRTNKNLRENMSIAAMLYFIGVIAGLVADIIV